MRQTESQPPTSKTGAVAEIINVVGLQHVMFETADPLVFEWYFKNYGNEVNLFVDHSQILQLEGLRQNIWATSRPGKDREPGARLDSVTIRRAGRDTVDDSLIGVDLKP